MNVNDLLNKIEFTLNRYDKSAKYYNGQWKRMSDFIDTLSSVWDIMYEEDKKLITKYLTKE